MRHEHHDLIEQHYAGVIENWDGRQVPADEQIRAARSLRTRQADGTDDAPKPLRALSERDPRKASGR